VNWLDYLVFSIGVAALAWVAAKQRRKFRAARSVRRHGDKARDYGVRTHWEKSGGKVNYSSFVFFDTDRDGRYGLADRPLGGIHVRLFAGDKHLRRSVTNINGFANFLSSTTLRRAPIRIPGTYRFEVSVPPGWVATGGNTVQSASFSRMPGSPAGLGAEGMLRPVGLAPVRHVGGLVSATGAAITACRGNEVVAALDLDAGTRFRFDLPEAADAVTVTGGGLDLAFPAGAYPVELGTVSPEQPALRADTACRTIDFDDLTESDLKKVPNGYAGLDWFNLNAMSRELTPSGCGYSNGTTSGDYAVYTSSGHPAEISCGTPFGLYSMMLTAAHAQSEGEIALVECWCRETLLRTDRIILSSLMPVRYLPMLPAVTRIRLSTEHYWQLVIDDVVVT